MNDPSILAAVGSTLLTVGGGAVATIKFLFTRLETSVNERIGSMEKHIGKLEKHVDDCEKDREALRHEGTKRQAEVDALRRQQGVLNTKMDSIFPGLN